MQTVELTLVGQPFDDGEGELTKPGGNGHRAKVAHAVQVQIQAYGEQQHRLAQADEDGSGERGDQQLEGDFGEQTAHGLSRGAAPSGDPPRWRNRAFSTSRTMSSATPTATMRNPQVSGSASVRNSCCITGA